MEISFIKSIKSKWLKLNNKFYQNNSLIKPQSMPMQDKPKPDIKLLFQVPQSMLPKTDRLESNGEITFQDPTFYQLISIIHSSLTKLL